MVGGEMAGDRLLEMAHRAQKAAAQAVELITLVKEGRNGKGMKLVREITAKLLRRAFILWLLARLRR